MSMTKQTSHKLEQAAQLIALAVELIQQCKETVFITEKAKTELLPVLNPIPGRLRYIADIEENRGQSPKLLPETTL